MRKCNEVEVVENAPNYRRLRQGCLSQKTYYAYSTNALVTNVLLASNVVVASESSLLLEKLLAEFSHAFVRVCVNFLESLSAVCRA